MSIAYTLSHESTWQPHSSHLAQTFNVLLDQYDGGNLLRHPRGPWKREGSRSNRENPTRRTNPVRRIMIIIPQGQSNCQKSWNKNIKGHTVHALRDIDEGEEITIYYLGSDKGRDARNEDLKRKFAFTCSCRLCSLPSDQSKASDKRLERISELDELLSQGGPMMIWSSPLQMLRYGPYDIGLPRAFFDAAQIVLYNGDLARGRIFLERAISGWRCSGGDDDERVLQHGYLVHDPSQLPMYGLSSKWKTSMDEVPSGLDPDAFEDWLWKRDMTGRPGRPSALHNRSIFPSFSELPDDCSLWTISLFRLYMSIRDMDDLELPLSFYTDDRGSEMDSTLVRKGYTVATIDAHRHAFAFDKPGIRLENSDMIKIFPISLQGLIQVTGQRLCHGCDKRSAPMHYCAKCRLFWYCDKTCQAIGWIEKKHKSTCKLLRDPNVK
ncbi:hypothetical protein GGR57DRAFT_517725 [Xylariaceae sp. FL1272]|nr:hypothetical protein GGR57DRAFT_517725 [Xylariaceae sp. FL1272]